MRTKEAKVSSVNDGGRVRFPREVIECRKAATDVSYAKQPPLGGIEDFCLGIYLVLWPWIGGSGGTSGGGSRTGERLHFGGWGGERKNECLITTSVINGLIGQNVHLLFCLFYCGSHFLNDKIYKYLEKI